MPKKTNAGPRIIVALDFPTVEQAWSLVDQLDPDLCRVKIGKEMFTRFGPKLVGRLIERGFDVFLDLKFHDIPNTVAAACAAAADLGVWMLNIHASGGRKMMEAARDRLEMHHDRPLIVAVTVLTSLGQEDIVEVGYSGTPEESVLRLAMLAQHAGMDGIVCSPREAYSVRQAAGSDFLLVTPGVRPRDSNKDDQQRVTTPQEAIRFGADFLVIGRPITACAAPLRALQRLQQQIAGVKRS